MDANSLGTPPVNNALLPDIYNKLDADLQERTRVINTQLDKRLVIQERVLSKYRRAAEKFYKEENRRVRRDLAKITNKLPAVGNIRNFCLGYYTRQKKPLKKRKGIPEDKPSMPFCHRHFIHHLPTKNKFYKQRTPSPLTLNPPIAIIESDVRGVSAEVLPVIGSITLTDTVVNKTEDSTDIETERVSELQTKPVDTRRVFSA